MHPVITELEVLLVSFISLTRKGFSVIGGHSIKGLDPALASVSTTGLHSTLSFRSSVLGPGIRKDGKETTTPDRCPRSGYHPSLYRSFPRHTINGHNQILKWIQKLELRSSLSWPWGTSEWKHKYGLSWISRHEALFIIFVFRDLPPHRDAILANAYCPTTSFRSKRSSPISSFTSAEYGR